MRMNIDRERTKGWSGRGETLSEVGRERTVEEEDHPSNTIVQITYNFQRRCGRADARTEHQGLGKGRMDGEDVKGVSGEVRKGKGREDAEVGRDADDVGLSARWECECALRWWRDVISKEEKRHLPVCGDGGEGERGHEGRTKANP